MAHHSSEISPEIRALFEKQSRQDTGIFAEMARASDRERAAPLGATGQFPEGKLTEVDEGEVRIGITDLDGKVVVDFGKPTAWIGFNPDQADDVARAIAARAAKIRGPVALHGRQFRKKPVVIEAFQMTPARRADNSDWPAWLHEAWNGEPMHPGSVWPSHRSASDGTDPVMIGSLGGPVLCSWGDWIIRGVKGELYPCKPDIFAATHEPVDLTGARNLEAEAQICRDMHAALGVEWGHDPYARIAELLKIAAAAGGTA
jgi:hypothetical protein